MENKILRLIRFTSAAAHIAGLAALFMGSEPLYSLPLLAWSFLFFLSSDNQIRESNSIILGDLKRAASLVAASLLFGSLLEAANFLLLHHYFMGVPEEIWLRWPFHICSLAVVIPLILEIERKLENLGVAEILLWRKVVISRGTQFVLLATGMLLLIILVFNPLSLYPLLWIILLLLTDPLLQLLGHDQRSISGQFEEGYYGQVFRLILSGVLFGFLWELWNFWAGAKWFYAPSGFDHGYLFELPLLEFWGYAFTALAAYAFFQLSLVLNERLLRVVNLKLVLIVEILALILILAAVLAGMDAMTTVSFRQVI